MDTEKRCTLTAIRWSSSQITRLVVNFELPDSWIPDVTQPTYRLLLKIITAIEECQLLFKDQLPDILRVMAPSYRLENLANFVRKVRRKKSNKLNELFPLISQSQASIIGPRLKAVGITEDWLKNSQCSSFPASVRVTNAMVLELNEYFRRNNHPWKDARRWLCTLLGLAEDEYPAIGTIETQFALVKQDRERKRKDTAKLAQFLETQYKLPPKRKEMQNQKVIQQVVASLVDQVVDIVDGKNKNNQEQSEIGEAEDKKENEGSETDTGGTDTDKDLHEMTDRYIKALEELDSVQSEISKMKDRWQTAKADKRSIGRELAAIKERFKQKVKTVDSLREKIATYTPRNVNKRVNRLKEANSKIQSKGGKQKTVPELVANLRTIIHHNHVISHDFSADTSGSKSYRSQEERRKLLAESVSKIHEQTNNDKIKMLSKKRQRESQRKLASPTKRPRNSSIPIPDFVGRRVEHLYEDELTGAEEWYEGTVKRRITNKRTKDPLKVLYEIHYEDGEQAEINLAEDFINGELRFIDEVVSSGDSDVPLSDLAT